MNQQETTATYSPDIFNVRNVGEAKEIILTGHESLSVEQRWETETPHLIELLRPLKLKPNSVVLDYGCGIGRMSKAIIEAFGCYVLGVDISADMRALSAHYVKDPRFFSCHPDALKGFNYAFSSEFDAAISVWVLQHCRDPNEDVDLIRYVLKIGAPLFVVNETKRFVPCKEFLWLDDGIDVRALLRSKMIEQDAGSLDPAVVSEFVAGQTYWAVYE